MSFDAYAYQKNYAKKHAAKLRAYRKAWMKRNSEKARVYLRNKNARYRNRHKKALLEKKRQYYLLKRESILSNVRNRHLKNPEKDNVRIKIWRSKNPHKIFQYNSNRRALIVKTDNNLRAIRDFVRKTKSKPSATCYYCQSEVANSQIHFDHIIPLSKGGSHSIDNICVSCIPCNLSKHARLLNLWNNHRQLFLSL